MRLIPPFLSSFTNLLPRWLVVGFGFLCLLVTLVVGSSIYYLNTLRNELGSVVNIQMQRISQAHEMRMTIRERMLSLDRIFLEHDPFVQDGLYLQFLNLGGRVITLRRELEPQAEDADEQQILSRFKREILNTADKTDAVVALYLDGRMEEGRNLLLSEAIPSQARVTEASDALQAFYREQGQRTVAHARQVYESAFQMVIGLGVGAILLTLLTASLVIRRIMKDRQSLLAEIEIRREAEAELLVLSGDLEEIVAMRTARLQEATDLLKEAQRIGQMGHWEWDVRDGSIKWSDEVYRLFGMNKIASVTSYDEFLQTAHPDDRDKVVTAMEKALIQGCYRGSHRILWPDGSIRYIEGMGRVTYGEGDRPLRMVGTLQDITEEQRLQQQLWDLAHHDGLTGLPNRGLLIDRLQQAIAIAHRQGTTLAVALFDLDRFKLANDSLGHAAGDRLLVEVASRLRGAVRQSDIVARFAGDEFVAVFPALVASEETAQLLDKILASFNAPCQLHGTEWLISASIGVAFYPSDARDAQGLLQAADEAMYAMKQAGRNGYRMYQAGFTSQ
ncbi:MAG: diguanylate cyclase domain-containing protein [Thiobacillus sp.]